jgi:opacity protein-like surface antigen
MLRITKVLGALLCATSTVCFSSDFYVGIGGGPEWGDFKQNRTVNDPLHHDFFVKNQQYTGLRGGFGTVFAGYGYDFDSIWSEDIEPYLGLEVNFNLSTVNAKEYNKEFVHETYSHTQYRLQRSFGVSLLPGITLFDDTLAYARIGYADGKFQLSTTDPSLHDVNKFLSGLRYGVGLQQELFEDLAVRMEWSTIAYKSVSTFTRDPLSGVTVENNISPQTSQVEFAAVYSF